MSEQEHGPRIFQDGIPVILNREVPDSTYFNMSDIEPRISDAGVIECVDDRGTKRRSWGAPEARTLILHSDCDFAVVLTWWHHKHGGGQQWYYFRQSTLGTIHRVYWRNLTEDEQTLVYNLWQKDSTPSWIRSPGKLRGDSNVGNWRETWPDFDGYKIVRVVVGTDGEPEYRSLFDNTCWRLDQRNSNPMSDALLTWGEHDGTGYYVYEDLSVLLERWAEGTLIPIWRASILIEDATDHFACVQCTCSGRRAKIGGKTVCSMVKPTEVVFPELHWSNKAKVHVERTMADRWK